MSTLTLEEGTSALETFPGASILEIFEGTLRFRITLKYVTLDFTHISKSSSIKKASPTSKAFGLGNAGEALSLVFKLLFKSFQLCYMR